MKFRDNDLDVDDFGARWTWCTRRSRVGFYHYPTQQDHPRREAFRRSGSATPTSAPC